MAQKRIECDWCGKELLRCPSQIKPHNFCSRSCLASFSSKAKNPGGYADLKDLTAVSEHMTALNKRLNPTRMTEETRSKLREAHLGSGEGKSYEKTFGVHTHRRVAEWLLGRPLKQGEVVHHIDENKRNNEPDNLMIFSSQALHAKWHKMFGGDAQ